MKYIYALSLWALGTICIAQEVELPWKAHVDPTNHIADIRGIVTCAQVSVSDSSHYSTKTLYQDPQRMAFQIIYPDRTTTLGVEGKYYWQHDGTREIEGNDFVHTFVKGHQFHAHLLFFDRLYSNLILLEEDDFKGLPCKSLQGDRDGNIWKIYYNEEGRILGMELLIPDTPPITMTCDEWKLYGSFNLPDEIIIDDGNRIFHYDYEWIRLEEGDWSDFHLSEDRLTDEQLLLRLHRKGMDDHFFERMEAFHEMRADSLIIVNRGSVNEIDARDFDMTMNQIMNSRDHRIYDDLIRPIVKVSKDGTLGWVIVEMAAKGVVFDAYGKERGPLDFESAWIELYEKIDGAWKMVGNVSNFKEQ